MRVANGVHGGLRDGAGDGRVITARDPTPGPLCNFYPSTPALSATCRVSLGLLAFISLKLDWLLIDLVGAGLTGACMSHCHGGSHEEEGQGTTDNTLLTIPHPSTHPPIPHHSSGSNLMGYMKCSSDAQKRLQASLTAGALTGLSYIPGALPALGNTMLSLISGQAVAAMGGGAAAPNAGPAPSAAGGQGGFPGEAKVSI